MPPRIALLERTDRENDDDETIALCVTLIGGMRRADDFTCDLSVLIVLLLLSIASSG